MQSFRVAGLLALVSVTLLATACAHEPYKISDEDKLRFGDRLISIRLPKHADPTILGLSDCKIYRAKIDENKDIVGWDVTLAADWAASTPAFLTGCVEESLKWDGKYVRVYLCARTIGAGGGCNNGGDYRSFTGARPWWVEVGENKWELLPEYYR